MARAHVSKGSWLGAVVTTFALAYAGCVPGEQDPDSGTGEPDFCGGIAGIQCPTGNYCNFPVATQCGSGDQGGSCAPIPDICTKEYAPVCGCDGTTYGNACTAAAAGVSIASRGACANTPPDEGDFCGGLLGVQCEDSQFCNIPVEGICGAADAGGTCTTPPDACTQIYDPVCGCDGNTYGNACSAASARVSVASPGECEPSP